MMLFLSFCLYFLVILCRVLCKFYQKFVESAYKFLYLSHFSTNTLFFRCIFCTYIPTLFCSIRPDLAQIDSISHQYSTIKIIFFDDIYTLSLHPLADTALYVLVPNHGPPGISCPSLQPPTPFLPYRHIAHFPTITLPYFSDIFLKQNYRFSVVKAFQTLYNFMYV